jgi:hypothetical protein
MITTYADAEFSATKLDALNFAMPKLFTQHCQGTSSVRFYRRLPRRLIE